MAKGKKNNVKRIATFNIEDITELCQEQKTKIFVPFKGKSYPFKRAKYFVECGATCAFCGIEGKFFALESLTVPNGTEEFFFTLFAIDEFNEEVFLTLDHIVPRSKGGSNDITNIQILCADCNSAKSNYSDEQYFLNFWKSFPRILRTAHVLALTKCNKTPSSAVKLKLFMLAYSLLSALTYVTLMIDQSCKVGHDEQI